MKPKSAGKHVGSSEAGGNVELSHQEVNKISPCNCDNLVVILGNVMSLFVIKTTGCAFNMQYMMKFPIGFFFFLHPLPPIQTLLQQPVAEQASPSECTHSFIKQSSEKRLRSWKCAFITAFIHQS